MPTFVPPLPGEGFSTASQLAERAGCSRQAIHDAIRNGRLAACRVAGRILIPENEAIRFIREWSAAPKGSAARWREYRAWQEGQRVAAQRQLTRRGEPKGSAP